MELFVKSKTELKDSEQSQPVLMGKKEPVEDLVSETGQGDPDDSVHRPRTLPSPQEPHAHHGYFVIPLFVGPFTMTPSNVPVRTFYTSTHLSSRFCSGMLFFVFVFVVVFGRKHAIRRSTRI